MPGAPLCHRFIVSFTFYVPLVFLFALGVPSCTSCAVIFPFTLRAPLLPAQPLESLCFGDLTDPNPPPQPVISLVSVIWEQEANVPQTYPFYSWAVCQFN